jgi:hypothetical protein
MKIVYIAGLIELNLMNMFKDNIQGFARSYLFKHSVKNLELSDDEFI